MEIFEIITLSESNKHAAAIELIENIRKDRLVENQEYIHLLSSSVYLYKTTFHYEKSIEDSKKIIELKPEQKVDFLFNIGFCQKMQGDNQGAIETFKEIIEASDSDYVAINNLASTYIQNKNFRDAINLLREFRYSDVLADQYLIAEGYYNLKEYDSAKYFIDRFIASVDKHDNISGLVLASKIYEIFGDKHSSCKYAYLANEIIKINKVHETLTAQPERVQRIYYVKNLYKLINEIKQLFNTYCL